MLNGNANPEVLRVIQEGAAKKKRITFNYSDNNGKLTVRTVEPYEIKGILLYAYCIERQGIRGFKLSQMTYPSVTKESFEPRFEVKIAGEMYGT
jgi:predicted DNA-binding transcriptional regulator YafY